MSSNKDEFKSNLRFDPTPYIKKDRLDEADGIRPGIAMMRPPTVRIEVTREERNILAHFFEPNEHNPSTCRACTVTAGAESAAYDTGYGAGYDDAKKQAESVTSEAYHEGYRNGYQVVSSNDHWGVVQEARQAGYKLGYETAGTDLKAASERWRKFGQHEGYKEGIARARAMVETHLESFAKGIEKGL